MFLLILYTFGRKEKCRNCLADLPEHLSGVLLSIVYYN